MDIVGGHTHDLGHGDEEVEEVDDFDFSVLLVEFLVFSPPFPGNGVDEFGHFLLHGAGVVEDPLGFAFFRHIGGIDADAFIKVFLQFKNVI